MTFVSVSVHRVSCLLPKLIGSFALVGCLMTDDSLPLLGCLQLVGSLRKHGCLPLVDSLASDDLI